MIVKKLLTVFRRGKKFKEMVTDIRLAEKNLGKVSYEITQSARSICPLDVPFMFRQILRQESSLSEKNIRIFVLLLGCIKYYKQVIGRAATDLKVGDRLTWKVID